LTITLINEYDDDDVQEDKLVVLMMEVA